MKAAYVVVDLHDVKRVPLVAFRSFKSAEEFAVARENAEQERLGYAPLATTILSTHYTIYNVEFRAE